MTDCKLWKVGRASYRGLLGQHRKLLHEEKVNFLQDVSVRKYRFKDYCHKDQLDSIAQLMKLENYMEGQVIIREGEEGDAFYMIQSGKVEIYKKAVGDKPIGTIGRQKYFGEKALLSDDVRAATCKAATVLSCYVLTRSDFNRVMGPLKDLFRSSEQERNTEVSKTITRKNKVRYQLSDLNQLGLLGQGAFGKVRLAKAKTTGKFYALKIRVRVMIIVALYILIDVPHIKPADTSQRKDDIVKNRHQEFAMNEYKLLMELSHPNILTVSSSIVGNNTVTFDLVPLIINLHSFLRCTVQCRIKSIYTSLWTIYPVVS
jgi:CRP-like cAMP-binding protein